MNDAPHSMLEKYVPGEDTPFETIYLREEGQQDTVVRRDGPDAGVEVPWHGPEGA